MRANWQAKQSEKLNRREEQRQQKARTKTQKTQKAKAKRVTPDSAKLSIRGFFAFLHKLFTRPTEIIAKASSLSRIHLILLTLLEAFVFGLLVLIFIRYSNMTRLAMLGDIDISSSGIWNSAFAGMIRGVFAALFLSLMRIVFSMLVFRFIAHQKVSFERLWQAFIPGTYYEILVTLLALIFVSGSGLQALVMLLCAFSIRTVIDTLSLKETVTLSQDRLLIQTSVIYFLMFLLLSFVLNLSVPSLANFGVVPRSQSPVVPNLDASPKSSFETASAASPEITPFTLREAAL